MAIEHYSRSESEKFSPPPTTEALENFFQDHLADKVMPVDEDEVNSQKLFWRGLDPAEALPLLTGDQEKVELRSTMPNTTGDWHTAISYGRTQTKYQFALGFVPEDDWKVQPATTHVAGDLQHFSGIMKYQQGNYIVNGDLHAGDVRYLIIRAHGDKPGKVGSIKYFRFRAEETKQ